MTRTTSAATVAAACMVLVIGVAAQGQTPGEPNPTDRGGEFTITGCVERGAGDADAPPVYLLTQTSAATGEGRAVGAMGAGVPMVGAHSSATPPSDPPDIVADEYRIMADEQVKLTEFVNHRVEARGRLQDAPEAGSAASGDTTGRRVFMATDIETLAETCTEAKGN